jgi:hypothetical protein
MTDQQIITSLGDILSRIKAPRVVCLDCSVANKGVDNYHIDVELSPAFSFKAREVIESQVKKIVAGNKLSSGNSQEMGEFRDSYTDMMRVTLHRYKTDLSRDQIRILQFAVVKFILERVRLQLDLYGEQLEETQAQQQFSGSRSLLTTQEKVTWFRKYNSDFLFRVNRLLLKQLQREENNQLKKLREQILGDGFSEAVNILYNPMLYARTPQDPLLLLECYASWPNNGAGFEETNSTVEAVLAANLPKLPFESLRDESSVTSAHAEVYDELGGLFAAQSLLGPSEDQKEMVSESFSWLEQPGNIRLLFDEILLEKLITRVKEEKGLKVQWTFKSDVKKLLKIAAELRRKIAGSDEILEMMATYTVREKLTQQDLNLIDVMDAVSAVAGNDTRKIIDSIDASKEGASNLSQKLAKLAVEFEKTFDESESELMLKVLTDISRYRFHLKYYRFAHRVFNRISVITDEEQLRLAKAGGQLFRLMSSEEVKQVANEQPDIVHHTILKADVRGSTTVTQELIRQDLNPASYFSLRFFDPISERLQVYGAVKVFIEGDAVILGTYEYEDSPAQWYSVSRACGMAKEMLDIVNSKNSHSAKTGLPKLEIGIGICFSDEKPLFLFDDKRAIMISSAIGDADRMSSCSWKLRGTFDAGEFNVEVLEIDDADQAKGEKGQDYIRYNVNGILLDDAAFEKLKTEVKLTRLSIKLQDKTETLYVGKFPDVQSKERHLVIREGRIGRWCEEKVQEVSGSDAVFYEVLPNSKLASQVINLSEKQAAGGQE